MSALENLVVAALIGLATIYLIWRLAFRRSPCDCCTSGGEEGPDYGQTLVEIQSPEEIRNSKSEIRNEF